MWSIDFQGQVALVTGGARGIGAACCRALAEAGARVAVGYSGSQRGKQAGEALVAQLEGQGVKALLVAGDVSKEDQVEQVFQQVEAALGPVSLLVHSAGTTSRRTLAELDAKEFRRILDVNLTGAFLVAKRAAAGMQRLGAGSMVLIGSQVSLTGGGGGAHYAASKAGLEGLVRHLTRELLPTIHVNAVLPSATDTELFRERYPDEAERLKVASQIPARRLGRPEDIADAVVFLLSQRASYICGQSLLVDGGRTMFR